MPYRMVEGTMTQYIVRLVFTEKFLIGYIRFLNPPKASEVLDFCDAI